MDEFDPQAVLADLRAGHTLSASALAGFAEGLADDSVSDAQAGAFAMGICKGGLTEAERVALTIAMRDTGEVLDWALDGPVIDKHSTGGVGDCTSLLLAPALAATGAFVPMISGRGLGHTGGTLDKLEAIPGLSTEVGRNRLRQIVTDIGCAIVGATGQIAPADKRLYAIRDLTATVPSVDLITSSILSKKLAAGLQALVLDVKVGSGAFMKSMDAAETLAEALVGTANGAGCPTAALITDMSEPLAHSMGNALEVIEVMEVLSEGRTDSDLWEVTRELGGTLLALSGLAEGAETGAEALDAALESGAAAEIFGQMVAAMGGPLDFPQRWRDRLPGAPVIIDVTPDAPGHVTAIDGESLGMIVVRLGGGRMAEGQRINPSVGLSDIVRIGDEAGPDRPLARIHAASRDDAERAAEALVAAITLGEGPAGAPPLVHKRVE